MAEDQAARRAAVYRLFAADGALLYVGSAYDPEERAKAHRRKDWWPLVARRTDEWHASRDDAYAAEERAIVAEDPAHNVSGTARNTGPAERGKILREAADARWRVAVALVRAGSSMATARHAGGWAEVEYLEASGAMPGLAGKLRQQMIDEGNTDNSRHMNLPSGHDGRLSWEMRPRELQRAGSQGQEIGSAYPPPRLWSDEG
ncbi:GIY-YIG nuclease family protein [Streptomyces sp. NBC_01590]|uniref:hypothetical protein n=1 Tax=Streptomyces sp. NBC_01590 TaxID=2975887 RepID=UPI003864CE9D